MTLSLRRGELYRIESLGGDTKRYRVVVVVSRERFLERGYSTAICAPVYSSFEGLGTEVSLGPTTGLKRESSIRCDELRSVPRSTLTNYVGSLSGAEIDSLDRALAVALGIDHLFWPR